MWGRARWNSYSAIALPNLSVCTAHSSVLSPELLVTIATHSLAHSVYNSIWGCPNLHTETLHAEWLLEDSCFDCISYAPSKHSSCIFQEKHLLFASGFTLPNIFSQLRASWSRLSWPIPSVRMPCRRHSSKDMKPHGIHFTRWSKFGSIPVKGLWNTTVLKHQLQTTLLLPFHKIYLQWWFSRTIKFDVHTSILTPASTYYFFGHFRFLLGILHFENTC